jgi:hypothetical protein
VVSKFSPELSDWPDDQLRSLSRLELEVSLVFWIVVSEGSQF